jgi:hypothetical protein
MSDCNTESGDGEVVIAWSLTRGTLITSDAQATQKAAIKGPHGEITC